MRITGADAATNPYGEEVVRWRRQQLVAAGFDVALAAAVAADPRWDLHVLLELADRGCPPRLAARILAPLEETGASR